MRLAFLITTVFHRLFQSRKNKQKWLVLLSLGSRLKITWHLIILQHVDWLKAPPSVLFTLDIFYFLSQNPTKMFIIMFSHFSYFFKGNWHVGFLIQWDFGLSVTICVQRTAKPAPSVHPIPMLDARNAPRDSISQRGVRHLASLVTLT